MITPQGEYICDEAVAVRFQLRVLGKGVEDAVSYDRCFLVIVPVRKECPVSVHQEQPCNRQCRMSRAEVADLCLAVAKRDSVTLKCT